MHPNSVFSARQILWTLTFAGQLVLLVVLLGRERVRRYPWFTVGIALFAVRLLAEVLLAGRMAALPLQEIFLGLADLTAIVGLLVVVEVARRAFAPAQRLTWILGTVALLAVACAVVAYWEPWPQWKELAVDTLLGKLRLLQLLAQKGDTLVDLLTVELGLLVVLFGRHFSGGWRSHTQKIAIGLSTVALAWMAVQGAWQIVARTVHPTTQPEYERIMGLGAKLVNANKVVYIAALIWWIAWLWRDEPGTAVAAETEPPALDQLTAETVNPAVQEEQ